MTTDTKAQIISAATKLFMKLSYHKVSTRAIAREAGCAHSLLHRHWPSKEALFADVLSAARLEFYQSISPEDFKNFSVSALMTRLLYNREIPIFVLLRHYLGNEDLSDALSKYNEGAKINLKNLPQVSVPGIPEIDRDSFLLLTLVMLIVPFEGLMTPYIGAKRAQTSEANLIHAFLRMTYHLERSND